MQDLLAGRICADHQRQKSKPSRKRRHQHRRQPLQASAHDHLAPERLALVQHQVDVVTDLEDAVAGADAGERDEADHRGHRQRLAREPQRDHAADQGQRDVGHDDQRQDGRAVAAVEHGEDGAKRYQREQGDQP